MGVHGVIGVAHAIFGSPINDADDVSDDFIRGLKHERSHTPSLNHHVLGLTSGSPINDADELSDDFIFGLLHHAVHGVIGVAHAILGSPINEWWIKVCFNLPYTVKLDHLSYITFIKTVRI